MTPLEFVLHLQKLETPDANSFNFYGDLLPEEAAVARKNLRRYLTKMIKLRPKILLVGEAPGRYGCAITGITFTSEHQILTEPFFAGGGFAVANPLKPNNERTACAIWNILRQCEHTPLLWNIYPFHPFDPNTRNNRCPTQKEISLGREVLDLLLGMFDIRAIYGVGRKAANALADHPQFKGYIRHPSYGGVAECKAALEAILTIRVADSRSESLPRHGM